MITHVSDIDKQVVAHLRGDWQQERLKSVRGYIQLSKAEVDALKTDCDAQWPNMEKAAESYGPRGKFVGMYLGVMLYCDEE
jgi:hypothetical protein